MDAGIHLPLIDFGGEGHVRQADSLVAVDVSVDSARRRVTLKRPDSTTLFAGEYRLGDNRNTLALIGADSARVFLRRVY